METRKLIDLLRATIDPNQRQQAEEQLAQVLENMCLRSTCTFLCCCGRCLNEIIIDTQDYWICAVPLASCHDG